MDKSDARISLEFYIRNGLVNRAHVTGITAGEKAEIVVEDVISSLLDPSALRAVMDYAKEQDVFELRSIENPCLRTVLIAGLDRIGDQYAAFNVKKEAINEIKRWCGCQ